MCVALSAQRKLEVTPYASVVIERSEMSKGKGSKQVILINKLTFQLYFQDRIYPSKRDASEGCKTRESC